MNQIHETLFTQSIEGVIAINKNYTIRAINPAAGHLLGYTNPELEGQPVEQLVSPVYSDFLGRQLQSVFNGGDKKERFEIDLVKKNGDGLQIRGAAFGNSGEKEFALLTFCDISAQKKAEELLRADERRIHTLIEHTPAAVAMFDRNMRYLFVSKRWLSDYGLDNRDIIGLTHYEVFPEISETWKDLHQRCLNGETLRRDEDSFVRANGKTEWVKWELCPWYSQDGIGGVILFTEVITERKKQEELLLRLNERLEKKVRERTEELTGALGKEKELNELKSRFITTASHEFRTPLSTLLSSIYILEKYYDPQPGGKEARHFNRIRSSVNHLTEILNDFLSLDQLENGEIRPTYQSFDLHELMVNLSEEAQGLLKPGQEVRVSYTGNHTTVQDRKVIRNILYNLLSNAIKFSGDDSPIRLIAGVTPELIRITVADEGIGIPANEQKYMFTRLFRARNTINIQGTGLGLNIVKRYAELVEGELTFESEEGTGSTFSLALPVQKERVIAG